MNSPAFTQAIYRQTDEKYLFYDQNLKVLLLHDCMVPFTPTCQLFHRGGPHRNGPKIRKNREVHGDNLLPITVTWLARCGYFGFTAQAMRYVAFLNYSSGPIRRANCGQITVVYEYNVYKVWKSLQMF